MMTAAVASGRRIPHIAVADHAVEDIKGAFDTAHLGAVFIIEVDNDLGNRE